MGATLLAAGLAAGDAAAQGAGEKYREASSMVAEGRYDEALVSIEQGLKAEPEHLDLRRLRGEVLLEKRDFEGALSAFERFLEANPRGANRRKARRIIRDLRAVKTTSMRIVVEPGPAKVYIDSKTLGVFCTADPECKKGMLPGSYELIIERSGFQPTYAEVEVELGKTATVTKELVAKPSKLTVSVVPANAEVTVDGKALPPDQRTVEVAAGEHVIAASLAGFATAEKKVTTGAGKAVAVELALAERIPVKVTPADAELLLDGKPVALEDGAVSVAPGGEHTLVARADGYREATATLAATRTPGQPVELELEAEAADPETPAVTAPAIEVVSAGSRRKLGAAFLFGAATVGVGLGTYFGLSASDTWQSAKEFCDDDGFCSSEIGVERIEEAQDYARASNVAFGVSLGVAAVAAVVWFTAPSAEDARREAEARSARPAVSIGGGPGEIGVSLGGSF